MKRTLLTIFILGFVLVFGSLAEAQSADSLPSWNDGKAKQSIIAFVELVTLRAPKLFNLRRDPFERADTDSNNYDRWWIEHVANFWPGAAVATEFFKTFEKFPPRQKPEKWDLSEIMERIQAKQVNK